MSDGRCLLHAYNEMIRRENRGEVVQYVQGTITNPHTGKTFQHAWIELTNKGKVIDPTTELFATDEKYYSVYNAKNIIKMEPFIATLLFAKGLRFVTKEEVSKAIKRDKEIMSQILAKRVRGLKK